MVFRSSDVPSGRVHRIVPCRKPAHVDPGFASDRDWFRLERAGDVVLVRVEEEIHLVLHEFRPTATRSHFGWSKENANRMKEQFGRFFVHHIDFEG